MSLVIFGFPLARAERAHPDPDVAARRAPRVHPMSAQHLTANIMSLGGIAVAIGAMVDASIS